MYNGTMLSDRSYERFALDAELTFAVLWHFASRSWAVYRVRAHY